MVSIFSKIISGDIPSYKIAETDHYIAFLDINPLARGHTLVVPKTEVDYLFDLDGETYAGLWLFARKVAQALHKTVSCERIGVAVVGLEVPHAHIHLVPIHGMYDIDFSRPKLKLETEEFNLIAGRVSEAISL